MLRCASICHWLASCILAVSSKRLPGADRMHDKYHVRPFHIDLSRGVPRMLDLVQNTHLPKEPEYPGLGDSAGIDLDVLKGMREQWLTTFDWNKEQESLNEFKHYAAVIEGLTIHFIHETSNEPGAIPLILNHGWPGSFLEFVPLIEDLKSHGKTSTGKDVSFHVAIPSLPGFAFSSAPPVNWTVHDTARVYNTLMTEVLGYETFATFGTDWGGAPSYSLYNNFNKTTRAAHFAFIPFLPLTSEQLAVKNITLDPLETFEQAGLEAWYGTGSAYLEEQTTKPNTIGLALYDNPVGQLAWIGEKFINWSDPRQGTAPSVVTHNEILRSVSLYYLPKSFVSSVFIYFQNAATGFSADYTKAKTDAPLLFSAFKYNVAFWPPEMVARVGNLVYYKNHDFGGHFPGVDNPPALLADLREIGTHWSD
ncbi:Putative epoxide hydrolase [Fulvia fulva]|nr:putative epoxide hydrolase [Fulvia fulva]WPV14246.1 Putative epoxide hydrolase [Fulvia fulva]WPV28389.1 Putative epoxide hydrolase [Fulvia fulva]